MWKNREGLGSCVGCLSIIILVVLIVAGLGSIVPMVSGGLGGIALIFIALWLGANSRNGKVRSLKNKVEQLESTVEELERKNRIVKGELDEIEFKDNQNYRVYYEE